MKQNKLTNRALGFAIAGLLMQTSQVLAEPLSLEFAEGGPDISVAGITFSYDAAEDILSATGTAIQYDSDTTDTSDFITIGDGSFSLTAEIDENGNLFDKDGDFSFGSFTITGNIGNGDEQLLAGDLTDFGFVTDDTQILEFVFDVTGGSVNSEFGNSGGLTIGASGLPNSTTPFTINWDNEIISGLGGIGTADAKAPVIPEPAEYSLILGMLLLTLSFVRKSNSN